ncbi:MAG: Eco57I restriction-modification methylase domain-containing protein [Paludibacteraceae bacterium]
MATVYTPDSLRNLFQSSFNLAQWYSFLQHFFNATELKSAPEKIIGHTSDDGYYLGNIDTTDSYRIGLFHYIITKGSVAKKRVGLRNLVKSFINPTWGEFDAALVVFDSGDHWRLSFICDIKGEATSPKRYTYVFGSGDLLYRTPIERFNFLKKKGVSFENLKTAFSVEALSDEFFDKYREQYADFIQYITGKRFVKVGSKWAEKVLGEPNAALMQAFDHDEKKIRDYVKKMMGRITFLHFLQRKGWMCGDLNYMQNMFENSAYKDDYLDSVLEPLFFGILNTKPAEREALFTEYGWNKSLLAEWKDLPYLNGGLFERDADDEPESRFPADYFKRLFQFFSEYNFTIDENDPNDAEVGVDPEMLGKIFENLLEDNKDKGAFYTPKEIVRYMCQESLIAYLETNTSLAKDKIRQFVLYPEEGIADIPDNKKPKLLAALQEVKICDPAIGSGAFPMGLLNELLHCREVLSGEHYDRAEIKKSIIQNNIYGVDIEKGAVDIARLRFWLSIVVDEETPSPLPNLDYKIMQGNSLVESFMGVDLSKLTYERQCEVTLFDDEKNRLQKTVSFLLSSYYSCCDHDKKVKLQKQISETINKQLETHSYDSSILAKLKDINLAENNKFFLWHTWFSDVFNRGDDKNGFDIVIGNPPYIQIKWLKEKNIYKKTNFHTYDSTGDIYCLFYEMGIKLLSTSGFLTYITSNKWLKSNYGRVTRNYILKESNPRYIIDLGAGVFDNASVDTNILITQKNRYIAPSKVTTLIPDIYNLYNLTFKDYSLKLDELWNINNVDNLSIKEKIEQIHTRLCDFKVELNYGILTGANKTFILSEAKAKELIKLDSKNQELIKPILRGKDLERYSANFKNVYLLCAHNGVRSDNIPPVNIMQDYPTLIPYFDSFGEVFKKRGEQGDTYFNLRNCAYIMKYLLPKILYADIVQDTGKFYLDEDGYYTNDTAFMIVGENLHYLLGVLNSKAFTFFYKNFYCGSDLGKKGLRFKRDFLLSVPIPYANKEIESEIVELVKKVIVTKKNNHNTNTVDWEESIDILVYKIYGLTDVEIKIIEQSI